MRWWLWVVLGLLLAVAETQIPTNFFLLAFGLAAAVVGALAAIGFAGPAWLQWLLFSGLSVIVLVVFSRTLRRSTPAHWDATRELDNLVGEPAIVTDDITDNGVGRAELRGTTWAARSAGGGTTLTRGTRCRVERVDGLTLWLRAE